MEGGQPPKRPREPPWPAWGGGSAEAEVDVPSVGPLRVELNVADTSNPAGQPAKNTSVVASGISYLDHMVDQLRSHALLAVGLRTWVCGRLVEPKSNELKELGADAHLVRLVGSALGSALRSCLDAGATQGAGGAAAKRACNGGAATPPRFHFHALLDEACTEFHLEFPQDQTISDGDVKVALSPYGIYPEGGRTFIGSYRVALTEDFFRELARSLRCRMRAKKIRGDNAHHIVESTFKAFGRSLRKAMDAFCGFDLAAHPVQLAVPRVAHQQRATKETNISVSLDLDPAPGAAPTTISTGITTFDKLLRELEAGSGCSLGVTCAGDVWIDEHHSVEDVMIAVGKALASALGDKGGCTRMSSAESRCGGACVLCVMDLSNRPYYCSGLRLDESGEEMIGDLSVEMAEHFFDSLVKNALMSCHFLNTGSEGGPGAGASAGDVATAAARSFGAALARCFRVDPRYAGAPASSKGTISK